LPEYHDDARYQQTVTFLKHTFTNGDPRFYEALARFACLHSDKNRDYAGDDPLANLKRCEHFGLPSWLGVVVRLSDKDSRFESWLKRQMSNDNTAMAVRDESVYDTLDDRAIYTILLRILLEEERSAITLSSIEDTFTDRTTKVFYRDLPLRKL